MPLVLVCISEVICDRQRLGTSFVEEDNKKIDSAPRRITNDLRKPDSKSIQLFIGKIGIFILVL